MLQSWKALTVTGKAVDQIPLTSSWTSLAGKKMRWKRNCLALSKYLLIGYLSNGRGLLFLSEYGVGVVSFIRYSLNIVSLTHRPTCYDLWDQEKSILEIFPFIMPEIAQLGLSLLCFSSLTFLNSFSSKNPRVFSNIFQLKHRLDSILAGS